MMKPISLLTCLTVMTGISISATVFAEPVSEGTFYLKAQHSGKCAHQHGASQTDGGAVTQWDCVDQPNVRLEKMPLGSGYFSLRFQHSGKCLALKTPDRVNDVPLIQETCTYDGKPTQTWLQLPGEGKFIKLQASNEYCLHQQGATLNNGDPITGWECVDQPNVRWEMVAYVSPLPTVPPITMIEKTCGEYADGAVAQFDKKVAFEKANQLDCRLGPNARWQGNRDSHYGWCVDNKANAGMLQAETAARDTELGGCYSIPIK